MIGRSILEQSKSGIDITSRWFASRISHIVKVASIYKPLTMASGELEENVSVAKDTAINGRRSATSKKLVSIFKGLLFVFCIGGFFYQIDEFITYFYTYPTVVDIEIRRPQTFMKPSITVCNMNPVNISAYCRKFPRRCEEPENVDSFCASYPFYCKNRRVDHIKAFDVNTELNANTTFDASPEFEAHKRKILITRTLYPYLDYDTETIKELAPKSADYLIWHEAPKKDSRHSRYVEGFKGPFVTNKGLICFIQNSRAYRDGEPERQEFDQVQRQSTSIGVYTVVLDRAELFDYKSKPSALIAIGSPFIVADPFTTGFSMSPGKAYNVYIRLEESHLLPHPYKTDCRDYEKERLENPKWEGLNAPRSQQVCSDTCWNIYNKVCFNCTRYRMPSINDTECMGRTDAFCDVKKGNEKLKKCLSGCKPECTNYRYSLRIQERPVNRHQYVTGLENIVYDFNEFTVFEVFIEEPEVLVYAHKPKYLDVEIFSYVGGFLGCWLGISIWSLCSLLLQVPFLLKAQLKKWFCHLFSLNIRS